MSGDQSRWDRFELRGQLGSGATGEVYRAFDPHLGREVALKIFSLQEATPQHRDRFAREGKIVARLSHPGIVRVFSTGQVEGRPYVVYEQVLGCRTLAEVERSLSPEQRVQYVIDAAEALGYAHQEGVVHRDVKLENLLLDKDSRLRVADFGHASASDLERMTLTGALVGTPLTMSPEQLTGRRGVTGPRADVWSLGVVTYRLLSGSYPFQASGLVELSARVTEGSYLPLRELAPDVSPAVEAVVARALKVHPEDRWSDGRALAEALAEALAAEPKQPRSSLPWLVAATLIGLVGVAAFAVTRLAQRPPDGIASPSPTPAPRVTPSEITRPVTPPPPVEPVRPSRRVALDALMAVGRYREVAALLRGKKLDTREHLIRWIAREDLRRFAEAREDLAAAAKGEGGAALVARAWVLVAKSAKNTPKGMELVRRAKERSPNDAEVFLAAARLETECRSFLEADRSLRRVDELSPRHWYAAHLRSRWFLSQGARDRAVALLAQARQRSSDPPPYRLGLQAVAIAAYDEDVQRLVQLVGQLIGERPGDVRLFGLRAISRRALGDEEGRRRDLAVVRARAPQMFKAQTLIVPLELIQFMAYLDQIRKARAFYDRQGDTAGPAAEIRSRTLAGAPWSELSVALDRAEERVAANPSDRIQVQLWRVMILRCRGRFAEAVLRLEELARAPNPTAVEARFLLGVLLQRFKDRRTEGHTVLTRLAARHANRAVGLAARSFLAMLKGDTRAQVEAARQALAKAPGFNEARLTLAHGLAKLRRKKESQAMFERCAELSPDLPRLHLLRGLSAHGNGDFGPALRDLTRWIRRLGGRSKAEFTDLLARANSALRSGHRFVAQADYEELLRRQPRSPTGLIGRGILRSTTPEALADWRAASAHPRFEQALALFPTRTQARIRRALKGL